jgi:hypothetical protein
MATQLKNMGHAALLRNGVALKHAALNTLGGRRRLEHLPDLKPLDQQILGAALRQLDALDREITVLEAAILRLGKDLPGLPKLLQIRGLSTLTAIYIARSSLNTLALLETPSDDGQVCTVRILCVGGDERIRTADLLSAIQALSQLSYVPTLVRRVARGHAFAHRRTASRAARGCQPGLIISRLGPPRPLRCGERVAQSGVEIAEPERALV